MQVVRLAGASDACVAGVAENVRPQNDCHNWETHTSLTFRIQCARIAGGSCQMPETRKVPQEVH
jgi:hypothetical protein